MLLEEFVLHLLGRSGYEPVENPGADPSLSSSASGLLVRGRGEDHQINAIGDQRVLLPFSNPPRMLIEAKCLNNDVGIEVIRNALGVLNDVSQFWIPPTRMKLGHVAPGVRSGPNQRRYHYQYAVVSAKGFSRPAQNFAFAHDIKLLPLGGIESLRPAIESVFALDDESIDEDAVRVSELRGKVRKVLRGELGLEELPTNLRLILDAWLKQKGGVLATTPTGLDLLLVVAGGVDLNELAGPPVRVSIHREGSEWRIRRSDDRKLLFTFSLPEALFDLTAIEAKPIHVHQFKLDEMQRIHAIATDDARSARVIQLELDPDWVRKLKAVK